MRVTGHFGFAPCLASQVERWPSLFRQKGGTESHPRAIGGGLGSPAGERQSGFARGKCRQSRFEPICRPFGHARVRAELTQNEIWACCFPFLSYSLRGLFFGWNDRYYLLNL